MLSIMKVIIDVIFNGDNLLNEFLSMKEFVKDKCVLNYSQPLNNIIDYINSGHKVEELTNEQMIDLNKMLEQNEIYIDYDTYLNKQMNNKYNNHDVYIVYDKFIHEPLLIYKTNVKRVFISHDKQQNEFKNYKSVKDFINDYENLSKPMLSLNTNNEEEDYDDFEEDENKQQTQQNKQPSQQNETNISDDNIVEETKCENEPKTQACKPIKEQKVENKQHVQQSSFSLGKQGEKYIAELINNVRPEFDVKIVANTGHLADIHADDINNRIKYIIEIKNKQVIINQDIIKFDNDVKQASSNNNGWFIVGIFMSLNADRIVGIGDSFKITQDNKIYMTPKYITKECLETIFTIMSSYKIVHGVATVKTITELPDNVYKLLNSLRNEYADIESTTKKYNEMIERNNENSKTILELKIALTVKKQFIEQINKICYNTLPIIDNRVEEINEDNLRDYINAITNKKNLRKRDLMAKFPTLQSIIGQMTVQQLWEKYKVITK